MALYINEQTGYFGSKGPDCFLVALVNMIIAQGTRKAARILDVNRGEVHQTLFKIGSRWDEIVKTPSQTKCEELPELVEQLFNGRLYGYALLCSHYGNPTAPQGKEKYFDIKERHSNVPYPSVFIVSGEKHTVIDIHVNGSDRNVISKYVDVPEVGHAYTFLGYKRTKILTLDKLIDINGSIILARPTDIKCVGVLLVKKN